VRKSAMTNAPKNRLTDVHIHILQRKTKLLNRSYIKYVCHPESSDVSSVAVSAKEEGSALNSSIAGRFFARGGLRMT